MPNTYEVFALTYWLL